MSETELNTVTKKEEVTNNGISNNEAERKMPWQATKWGMFVSFFSEALFVLLFLGLLCVAMKKGKMLNHWL